MPDKRARVADLLDHWEASLSKDPALKTKFPESILNGGIPDEFQNSVSQTRSSPGNHG